MTIVTRKMAQLYMEQQIAPQLRELLAASRRYWDDRVFQDLNRNYWAPNPGELDRWADDGGPVVE